METISCIFCDSSGTPDPVVIRENGFDGHQCPRCNLIYVSPRPSLQEISNLYAHDEAKTGASVLKGDEYNRRLAARHALRMLRSRKAGGTLLEIGAGMGFFCDEARAFGYTPKAIELNRVQAEHIRRMGIPVDNRTLATAYPGMRFDVIYHCDVLSHFTDPVAEFKTMVDRLNPGGMLMFETGNFGDVRQRYYRLIPQFQYPDHLFFFSQSSLRMLLDRSGLRALKIQRYNRLPEMLIQRNLGAAGAPAGERTEASTGTPRVAGTSGVAKLKKLVRHSLVYGAGAIFPGKLVPQTLIVIAEPNPARARVPVQQSEMEPCEPAALRN